MQTRLKLGELDIHRLGFGAMRASGYYRPEADRTNAIRLLRRTVELGVDFIDTADSYGLGANEDLLAEALHPYGGVLIATKVGRTRPSPTDWTPCGRPEYLKQAAELSLRRLKVERIDLLQLHRIDPTVPYADQLGALAELVAEGKVRHLGLSEVTVDQLREARETLDIVSVQNRYNLTDRDHEDVLDYCTAEGIAFIPYVPIAKGEHAGSQLLASIANELGATAAQLSLAWLLHRSPVIVPIPGTRSIQHLEENVAAADVTLSVEHYARLEALSPTR
ncbi:aldo/keto reductase [Kribbella sp. NPDC005582]|uniref:aldo/keto reductase n=1 Tax=Kribbella sp. NPDC005582 TaxID=3156893 RepID=UPI0033A7F45E